MKMRKMEVFYIMSNEMVYEDEDCEDTPVPGL